MFWEFTFWSMLLIALAGQYIGWVLASIIYLETSHRVRWYGQCATVLAIPAAFKLIAQIVILVNN